MKKPFEDDMKQDQRANPLELLDPGTGDRTYWDRFHGAVLQRARFELARRREHARQSVAAVLSGWSRSLIPVALAAAAIAAVMVGTETRRDYRELEPLALEDILRDEVGDGPLETLITGAVDPSPVAFMTLVEGDRP